MNLYPAIERGILFIWNELYIDVLIGQFLSIAFSVIPLSMY